MKLVAKVLKPTLLTLNLLAALALLISYLSVNINPADFWIPALFGLVTPLLLALNFIFITYWIIRWKKYILISTFAIIIGIPQLVNYFRFRAPQPPYDGPAEFTILTYNVNLFRLYAWSRKTPTMYEVANLAREKKADILCLQEFYTNDTIFSETQAKRLFQGYAHIHYVSKTPRSNYGIATFSKFPIVDQGEIHFENSLNTTIFTDIKIGVDTIRVYNNHLQSFRFNSRDLAFIKKPSLRAEDQPIRKIKGVSSRIRTALQKRAVQVMTVKKHINNSPYPTIVCGDFNDSPISYTYKEMKSNLTDAFLTSGDGFGTTYQNIFPSFRIDYILHSQALEALDFDIPQVNLSDHFPILVPFQIKEKKQPKTLSQPTDTTTVKN